MEAFNDNQNHKQSDHLTPSIQHPIITMADSDIPETSPPVFNYILGFLCVGIAWGFTTPFIRKAAQTHSPPPHPILDTAGVKNSWLKSKVYGAFFGVVDLLRNPRYALPLVINLTGSIWFFLLIGKAGTFTIEFSFFFILSFILSFEVLFWESAPVLSIFKSICDGSDIEERGSGTKAFVG